MKIPLIVKTDVFFQIALLAWLKGGDNGKQLLETVTGLKVGRELYNRLSGEALIEQYRVSKTS